MLSVNCLKNRGGDYIFVPTHTCLVVICFSLDVRNSRGLNMGRQVVAGRWGSNGPSANESCQHEAINHAHGL